MPTPTDETPLIRWHADVHYRTFDDGPLLVEHDFEELAELHERIELGPPLGHHREDRAVPGQPHHGN